MVGWFADSRPEEIAVYFLAQAIPAVIVIAVGSLQGAFGPDWRKGMHRCAEDMIEYDRQIEERRRKGFLSHNELMTLMRTNPEAWHREAFKQDPDHYPQSAWWPPHHIAWDGSCPELGLESDHITAMRSRWPAWFAKYERRQ